MIGHRAPGRLHAGPPSILRSGTRRRVSRDHERRDIRSHFLPDPIPPAVLGRILNAAHHSPSVGFMQPWDFIVIQDAAVRKAVRQIFLEENRRAAGRYEGGRRTLYESLKLEGISEAPLNLCVTCDRSREKGAGLGRQTDSTTDLYSTVCAIQNLWLAARAESLGVGWVSILDFDRLRSVLAIPPHIAPVAYLCIGYVSEFPTAPELETAGWETRENLARLIHFDTWDGRDAQRAAELFAAPVGDEAER
jgi:5,6-dimethylbenzimidazole synthase